jgi:hypothetical protein
MRITQPRAHCESVQMFAHSATAFSWNGA